MAYVSVSCSDEMYVPTDDNMPTTGHYFVLANTETAASTRVAYDASDYNKSTFEEGDKVGVFVMDASGNAVKTNIPYAVKSSTEEINGKTYQYLEPESTSNQAPESEDYTYAFVYPYNANMTFDNLKSYSHSVEADQSSESATSNEKFEKSDLLWDVVKGSATQVNIDMDHAMAQIIVVVDNEISDVKLCQTAKTSISGLDLSKSLETWRSGTAASADANSTASYITMWSHSDYQNSESGKRVYRCVVPAQTFAKGAFLSFKRNGSAKTSSLSEDLTVQAGKNYLFILNKSEDPLIIDDDESWVLDVIDPTTNKSIGLLCREYVRYQPASIDAVSQYDQSTEFDKHTGTDNGSGSKWISSQAWVFYNLKKGYESQYIPDLSQGTVMLFIYDLEKPGDVWWPVFEDNNYHQHGIFAPKHGATWCTPYNTYASSAEGGKEQYNADGTMIRKNYGMNGGVITWDGSQNKITSFTMPTKTVYTDLSSSEAIAALEAEEANAHIKITRNADGSVKDAQVSYDATTPVSNRGILIPHNLVDRRINSDKKVEIHKYPLVKIGFNDFWMSKPLSATTMVDGTALTCYNKKGEPGVNIAASQVLDAGYVFPYATNVSHEDSEPDHYDPYNNPAEMNPSGSTYTPAPLYNRVAVENSKFMPTSTDDRMVYVMPGQSNFLNMKKYFGVFFGGKLMSRYISPKSFTNNKYDEYFIHSKYRSLLRGELQERQANAYVANISGFNWRPLGYVFSWSNASAPTMIELGQTAALMLQPDGDIPTYCCFNSFNVWGGEPEYHINDGKTYWDEKLKTQFFAQVRFLFNFKYQDSSSSAKTRASEDTVASSKSQQPSNTVYVRLTEK